MLTENAKIGLPIVIIHIGDVAAKYREKLLLSETGADHVCGPHGDRAGGSQPVTVVEKFEEDSQVSPACERQCPEKVTDAVGLRDMGCSPEMQGHVRACSVRGGEHDRKVEPLRP